jgi:hypothetical protein
MRQEILAEKGVEQGIINNIIKSSPHFGGGCFLFYLEDCTSQRFYSVSLAGRGQPYDSERAFFIFYWE